MENGTVIVKLMGGLGNQMFQYALGRRLSLDYGMRLKLDKTWFDTVGEREYGLHYFSTVENIAKKIEIMKLKDPIPLFKIRSTHIHERTLAFDPEILDLTKRLKLSKKSVYLDGYWQNEKYFENIEKTIREDFRFNGELTDLNAKFAMDIKRFDSIAIHVRRGDYISKPSTNQFHGTCSLQYYQRAIEYIEERVLEPCFFIFSDDPEWAKENIYTNYSTIFISHNADKPHEDLRLMSLCKHFIIANSSFSWWGAWLSSYEDKIVIAPLKWFQDPNLNNAYGLPEKWVRM